MNEDRIKEKLPKFEPVGRVSRKTAYKQRYQNYLKDEEEENSIETSPVEEVLNYTPAALVSPTEIINIASVKDTPVSIENFHQWEQEKEAALRKSIYDFDHRQDSESEEAMGLSPTHRHSDKEILFYENTTAEWSRNDMPLQAKPGTLKKISHSVQNLTPRELYISPQKGIQEVVQEFEFADDVRASRRLVNYSSSFIPLTSLVLISLLNSL